MQALAIIQTIILWAVPLLFAITVHEVAHGYVANKLGDPTAKMLGRLTLNPVKHIDPLGTIILPIGMLILSGFKFAFGWAKPVPVTWQNLKNPRRDMALVAVAGPAVNLLMAMGWGMLAKIAYTLGPQTNVAAQHLFRMGFAGVLINILLMVLNMLPIPPLDGSRVLASFLPPKMTTYLDMIEPYGFIILIVLLLTGGLKYILYPFLAFFLKFIFSLYGIPMNF